MNGVSPPVGADAVTLKDGDRVLWYWATFGPSGRAPDARAAARAKRGCYRVLAQDDTGKTKLARAARLHAGGRSVLAAHRRRRASAAHQGLVTATLTGAVRSNALR